MTNEEIMRRVIEMARQKVESGQDRVVPPIVAVVAKDGEIIGQGFNTAVRDHDPTAHAEVAAIRDTCRRLGTWDLSGCELYTIAEPCSLCVGAIYFARLDRLYYASGRADAASRGTNIDPLLHEVARPIGERRLPSEQLLRAEAVAVLGEWAAKPYYPEYIESLKPNPVYEDDPSD